MFADNRVDANTIKQLQILELNYDVLEGIYIPSNSEYKEFLGEKQNKKCRFCGKTDTHAKFKKIAHAIPELLGNKNLFSYYECDECNQKFSETLENHLSSYLSYYRALVRMRGKRGGLKFKQHDLSMKTEDNILQVQASINSDKISIDEETQQFSIKIKRDKYIPIAVYKCFVKIALTVIKEKNDLEKVKWAIDWISEKDHNNSRFKLNKLCMQEVFTPGNMPYDGLSVEVYRRKKRFEYKIPYALKVQYMMCVVKFQNWVFKVDIPSYDDFNKDEIKMQVITYPIVGENYLYGKSQYKHNDMSGTDVVDNDYLEIYLGFEKIEEIVGCKTIEEVRNCATELRCKS